MPIQFSELTGAEQLFVEGFKQLQTDVYETGSAKGWWDTPLQDEAARLLKTAIIPREVRELLEKVVAIPNGNDGEKIALMHSELSEGLEAMRHGNPPDDKIPEFSSVEAELADVVIRAMDFCEARGYDLAGAIVAKARMNKTRPVRHGGKLF